MRECNGNKSMEISMLKLNLYLRGFLRIPPVLFEALLNSFLGN